MDLFISAILWFMPEMLGCINANPGGPGGQVDRWTKTTQEVQRPPAADMHRPEDAAPGGLGSPEGPTAGGLKEPVIPPLGG